MELEDLKNIWQQNQKLVNAQQNVEYEEILAMTRQKSKDTVAKLKRNILWEVAFSCVTLLLLFLVFREDGNNHLAIKIIYFFLILFVFFGIIYWREFNALSKFQLENISLKEALQQLIKELQHFIKFYFLTNVILTPICMFLGFYLGGYSWVNSIKIPLILTVISSVPVYYFTKKYVKRVYGNHLEKLKKLLAELEEQV
jgi:hypothetical protein